jgi:hypothetical protein
VGYDGVYEFNIVTLGGRGIGDDPTDFARLPTGTNSSERVLGDLVLVEELGMYLLEKCGW